MTGVSGDDWNERQLLDVTQSAAPIGYGIVQPGPYVRGGVPVLAIRDLAKPSIRTAHRSSPTIEAAYRRSRVTAGDVLISVKGTTGRIGIVPLGFEGNISRDVARVRLTHDHDPGFWVQLLRSFAAQQTLQLAAVGSTRQELSIGTLKTLRFRFPSRPEQMRIAKILSDVDQLIATLELMIAKKHAIKQGMMQRLLGGETRLPGFIAPWVERSLGEISAIDSEALGSSTSAGEIIDYISLEDVSHGVLLGSSRIPFRGAPSRARRVIRPMDVLFGTVRPNLQSHAIYTGGLTRPIASTGFAVARALPGVADSKFLFYLLMSRLASVQIERIIAGSNYPAVSSGDVRKLTFDFPDLGEQVAIGDVLADCDAEVGTLRIRLAKAKAVKQGMMQELLTGHTRIPIEEGAT